MYTYLGVITEWMDANMNTFVFFQNSRHWTLKTKLPFTFSKIWTFAYAPSQRVYFTWLQTPTKREKSRGKKKSKTNRWRIMLKILHFHKVPLSRGRQPALIWRQVHDTGMSNLTRSDQPAAFGRFNKTIAFTFTATSPGLFFFLLDRHLLAKCAINFSVDCSEESAKEKLW